MSLYDTPAGTQAVKSCLEAVILGDTPGALAAATAAGCRVASVEEGLGALVEALLACDAEHIQPMIDALDGQTVSLSGLALAAARNLFQRGHSDGALQSIAALGALNTAAETERGLSTMLAVRRGHEAAMRIRKVLTPARPLLYSMPKIKREMIADFGLEVSARIFAAAIGNAATQSLEKVALVPLIDWARAHSTDYRQIRPSREIRLRSPEVLDRTRGPDASWTCRTTFAATLRNAVVSGKSNYILFPGTAVSDFQNDELALCPLDYDVDPVLFMASPDTAPSKADGLYALMPAHPRTCRRVVRALSLLGIHSYAFGHWMCEFLPKLWHFLDSPGFADTTILIDRQMPEQHLEALRLFVGPTHPVLTVELGEPIAVDELLVAALPGYVPAGPKPGLAAPPPQVLDMEAFLPLVGRAVSRLQEPAAGRHPERLFLSRKPLQHRKLVNQDEVNEVLESRGFVAVDFGDLPFRLQVEMIRSARTVIAPDGSSALLLLLARPGTRVGLLTHGESSDEMGEQFCHDVGLRYIRLVGETVKVHSGYRTLSDYRIAPERLNRLVDALERD